MPPESKTLPGATVSSEPTSSATAPGMMLEQPFPQPRLVRRSILKPSTFRVHFLIPPDTECTTPLPKELTNRIPLELLHYCIDSLRYDKDTLRNCALVCKTWLARARPLLLPKKPSLVIRNETGEEIFGMIAAPRSALANFVHTLSIQTTTTFVLHTLQHADPESPSPTISFNEYLLPFVGNCQALRTLIFQGVQIPPRTSKNISAISSQIRVFPHLTRLELTRCAFWTFEELLLVICARRSLQELFLTDITVLQWLPDQSPPENLQLPRRLHTLHLNTPGQTLLLTWILSRVFIPPLKAVSLGGVKGAKDQKVLGLFLKALGPDLEHLKLNLVRATHEVNLVYNTGLQSLSISHYLIAKLASENISPTGGLVKILGQLTSTEVTKIDIHFVNAPHDLMLMPWSAVAEELSADKFSRLKLVRLRLAGKKSRHEEVLRKIFPRLSSDEVLRILWDSSV